MDDVLGKVAKAVGTVVLVAILVAGVGLIAAFPIKWAWNAVIPYLFGLPVLTWGKAWCLNFLAGCLIRSINSNQK